LHLGNPILQARIDLRYARAMPDTPQGLLSRLAYQLVLITQGLYQRLDSTLIPKPCKDFSGLATFGRLALLQGAKRLTDGLSSPITRSERHEHYPRYE
jgi:hypothetical protein